MLTGEVHQLLTGQVRNDTSQTHYSVSVTVTFFYTDPSGKTTSNSGTSLLLANMIQPGEVVPFNVGAMLPGCSPSPGVYQVTINPGSTTSPTRYTHQFSFSNTRAGLCLNGLFACVTGTVTNTGSVSANSVIVVATLLNPQEQPYCANNLSIGSLAPGQSMSFEISCSTTIPASFSLLAEGQT
ncbi:MAG: FxLYD domain-containing protein [Candidatus Limnocylindrales bacterium]